MYIFELNHLPYRVMALVLAGTLLASCSRPAVIEQAASEEAAMAESASENTDIKDDTADTHFSIAVNKGNFNPYITANTLTEQSAGLLFEKLVAISPSMQLENRLAAYIENSDLTVTVYLRSGCSFADGTSITAQDVAASLQAAKDSELYAARLANLTDIEVSDNAVVLTLAEPDSLFAYLLDLPIMKADEVALAQPTASGRYTYGSEDAFVPNAHAPFPENGPEIIELTAVSNYDGLVSALAMGTVSAYLAEDGASSTVATSETHFRTNTLMFLGVNAYCNNPLCTSSSGRTLLSRLLSRKALADEMYSSGVPATGAINSLYACVQDAQVIQTEADTQNLSSSMARLGFTFDEATGYYQNGEGEKATVSILVFSGSPDKLYAASLLQQQWAARGIEVTLDTVDDFNLYLQQIRSQEFELYIGEMKLYNNIDLSPFWKGSARYGLAVGQRLQDAYTQFRADASMAGIFEEVFADEMPYIPLLWQRGVVVSNRRVTGIKSSVSDLYYSLEDLSVAG